MYKAVSQGSSQFVQCERFYDGLYLLQNNKLSTLYPDQFSFCVADCQQAHYQHINNPVTQKCQDCGKYCKSCNLQLGCETCSPYNTGNQGWVNALDSSATFNQTAKKCVPCNNNKYCLSCDPNDVNQCLRCSSKYNQTCSQNGINSILDNCIQGEEGNDMNFNHRNLQEIMFRQLINLIIKFQTVMRISQDIQETVCSSCLNGFLVNGACQSTCPTWKYPEFVFSVKGITSQSYCQGSSSNQCTKWKVGQYLEYQQQGVTYGTCVTKTATSKYYRLYVSAENQSANYKPNIESDGYNTPFYSVDDAIRKTVELCASSIVTCSVEINLYKGDHYILRSAKLFYMPSRFDNTHQVTNITIQPLFCSQNNSNLRLCVEDHEKVTIFNKFRDQFTLTVGSGLIIKNIVIDWIDSIILRLINVRFLMDILLSSLILLRRQFPLYIYKIPQQNCVFRNLYFHYNTFIETNSYGGYLEIFDTIFERFATCGSIIRNLKQTYNPPNPQQPIQTAVEMYLIRSNILQQQVYSTLTLESTLTNSPFTNYCSATDLTKPICFSINISNTQLIQLNHLVEKSSFLSQVGSKYKMINYGKISIFLLGEKDKYQLKHLISIQEHKHGIQIIGNIFQANSVIKGLINIQVEESVQSLYPILIAKNQFIQNAAYFQTVAIHIRLKSVQQYTVPITNSSIFCTGVSIQQNLFEKNFGCAIVGGSIVNIECYNPNQHNDLAANDDISKLVDINNIQQMYYRDFDYSTITAQNIQDFQYQDETLRMDLYMVSLKENTYNKNYAGNKEGLITGYGLMRIEFSKEQFINNGENANDLIPFLNKIDESIFRLIEEDQSEVEPQQFNYTYQATNDQGLSIDDLNNYLLKSQIFLQSVSYVILEDIYSEGFINLQVQYSSDKGQQKEVWKSSPYLRIRRNMLAWRIEYKWTQYIQHQLFYDDTYNNDISFIFRYNYYVLDGMNKPMKPSVDYIYVQYLVIDSVKCINCAQNMNHFFFYSEDIVLNNLRVLNINMDLPTDELFSYNSQTRIFTIYISDTSKQNFGKMRLFSNSHFENINGDYGSIGIINSYENQPAIQLLIFNTTIINSQASNYGGAFVIARLSLSNLTFLDCKFKNVRSTKYGGILYAKGQQDRKAINMVAISRSIIEDTNQISIGLAVYIKQTPRIILQISDTNVTCNTSFQPFNFDYSNMEETLLALIALNSNFRDLISSLEVLIEVDQFIQIILNKMIQKQKLQILTLATSLF
ncbi:UNKNOWN [Stylonychia lemnae]|uniref:Uncharacterized protein n=1 Tax=Stylonychia lemnae TaxID=5949 RepID=A0A077ZTS3_STYLE|nr:UNKNOWN [Stylonychia lemnae]|eukprot:CDW71836.1 UNKNOWN [Stylonychia lemnae]